MKYFSKKGKCCLYDNFTCGHYVKRSAFDTRINAIGDIFIVHMHTKGSMIHMKLLYLHPFMMCREYGSTQ